VPYFPFSARICLNQHHWLARRRRHEGIDFQQTSNAFLKCGDSIRLQKLADSLTTGDLLKCGQKWLAILTPFFTDKERREIGCPHRLFFSQVEYCDNLIFYRRAAVDELTQRLLDVNRNIGQPKKITTIFGRKITKQRKQATDHPRRPRPAEPGYPQPLWPWFPQAICTGRPAATHRAATHNVYDYGVNKDVENLPQWREKTSVIIDNYHNAQQDILETFVDRGQLRKLAAPTVLAKGKRIPGLKLDQPRQLAVMHALV
jgi:hypothetical protein